MDKKIIVAGHVALDLTPVFPTDSKYESAEECFIPGMLINVGPIHFSVGGAVSNTGLALKKMGADVDLMGKVGDDNFGKIIENIYASFGAGGLIVDKNVDTSYTIILAPQGIDRIFFHDPAANNTFRCEDIPDSALEGVSLFHFGYPPLMRSMYENDGSELLKIFKRVKSKGIMTSLDMAAVDPHGECAKTDWYKVCKDVLPYVDFFVPSLDEILAMLGPDFKTAKEAANECFRLGAKNVLIKCGTDGMYFKNSTEEGLQEAYLAPFVASATGAGDTAIAAFLYAMMDGKTISEAAKYAAAQGACCVQAYDTVSSLKDMAGLTEMIKEYESK